MRATSVWNAVAVVALALVPLRAAALTPTPTAPPTLTVNAIPNPAREGQTVTLAANRLLPGTQPTWSQLEGPSVTLAIATQLEASFVAPAVTQETTLVFRYELPPTHEYRDVAVLVLPANGIRVAIFGTEGPPGGDADVNVFLDPVALPVAALRHRLAFPPEASVQDRGDGTPDCSGAPTAATAVFSFLPAGCAATQSCAQVAADLTFDPPRTAHDLAYTCRVSLTDRPTSSCQLPLTCAGGDGEQPDGADLIVGCTDGAVTSRYADVEPEYGLRTEPANPQVGDDVRLIFSVSFAGGLAHYSISGLWPLLDGGSQAPDVSTPGQVVYTLHALRSGTAFPQLYFDYETTGGCPGNQYFYFRYSSSPPFPLEIADPHGVRVSGRVAEQPGCQGAMRNVEVQLEPGRYSTRTDLAGGEFAFTGVSPGDYAIGVFPPCNPFGCWEARNVHIGSEDVTLQLCPQTLVCAGDCNGDRRVTIDELISGVGFALGGNAAAPACPAFDVDGSGLVQIDELVSAVNAALDGCSGVNNTTPTSTFIPPPTPTPAP